MKPARRYSMAQVKAAIRYTRGCLAIMDGSVRKGIRRIGMTRYKETIRDVLKVLPNARH